MHKGLEYLPLIEEARTISTKTCERTVRLAILADFATQQLIPLIRVLCARAGYWAEIYEAPYDSIESEIINPESELYTFQPNFIAILSATEKLKGRFYATPDRTPFPASVIGRFTGLWGTLKSHSNATIIQGNYVLPTERAFGNFENRTSASLGTAVQEINYALARAARETTHVLLCDVDYLAAAVGRFRWSDERLWFLAKTPCALPNMPLLADALTDVVLTASGRIVKCVVLDLDNTLWGGVIGDDGLSGISVGGFDEGEAYVAFQRFLLELKRRGIILAVVSKNDHENAITPFREHPEMVLREEDIAVFLANWDNKVDNIRAIQKTLNIGFDSMVFLDDNPFERNIVRQFIPNLIVPELPEDPAHYIRTLAEWNLFETSSFSEEDRQRPEQYRQESQREVTRLNYADMNEYLRSLEMKIKLERFNSFSLPRIAQLIQRSNQFNLATRRHSQAACESFMIDEDHYAPFTLTLSDKFGDYGLICVVVLKLLTDEIEIDEFLMSCRVLQRGVEQFAMNQIVALGRQRDAAYVRGRYVKTQKNKMVTGFYDDFGFEKAGSADGATEWRLDVTHYEPRTVFLEPVTIDPPFSVQLRAARQIV